MVSKDETWKNQRICLRKSLKLLKAFSYFLLYSELFPICITNLFTQSKNNLLRDYLKLVSTFFFFTELYSPSKTTKNAFYFIEKALFIHVIFKFFWFFHSFPHFPKSKDKWKWYNLWCHELVCINLQMQVLK